MVIWNSSRSGNYNVCNASIELVIYNVNRCLHTISNHYNRNNSGCIGGIRDSKEGNKDTKRI